MKGLLKAKSPGTQLLILIGVALVSFSILGLVATFLFTYSSGLSLNELKDTSKLDFSKPGVISYLRGMQLIQFITLFAIPTFLCAWLFSDNTSRYLGLKKPSNSLYYAAGILAMIVALPFVGWLGDINKSIPFPAGLEHSFKTMEEEASRTMKGLLSRHTVKDLLLNLFFVAALAGIGEELLFRGMLQRLLIRIFRNPWVGIIMAAVIFSAIHLEFYGFLPRLALGMLLGIVYWYSGSLWVAIFTHLVYDASLIVLAYFRPEMLDDDKGQLSNMALMAACSFLLVSLIVTWMIKRSNTRYQEVYANDHIPVKDHPFDF